GRPCSPCTGDVSSACGSTFRAAAPGLLDTTLGLPDTLNALTLVARRPILANRLAPESHGATMTHRPPTVRARTRLSLQAFEPRDCPACTVVEAGTTLYVLGDNTANTVVITDSGPARGPNGSTPAEFTV